MWSGGYANGERAGDQIFGALSSGYELPSGGMLVAPYGRVQFSSTLLQDFTESGIGVTALPSHVSGTRMLLPSWKRAACSGPLHT